MKTRLGALVDKLEVSAKKRGKRHCLWIEGGDTEAAIESYGRDRIKLSDEVIFVGWQGDT